MEIFDTSRVDLVVLSHPDGDHIGGLGRVVRQLDVETLALHRPALHGGSNLRASGAVEDLVRVAQQHGVRQVLEPFAGVHAFDGAIMVASPSESAYERLIRGQVDRERQGARRSTRGLTTSRFAQRVVARVLPYLPREVPFDDAGGDSPRNNSSTVLDLRIGDERTLFTADAGVPALTYAADFLDWARRADVPIRNFQVPHHGSRHNLSSMVLDRLLGAPKDDRVGWAFISISAEAAEDPRYPSPRVTNACLRRGYPAVINSWTQLTVAEP